MILEDFTGKAKVSIDAIRSCLQKIISKLQGYSSWLKKPGWQNRFISLEQLTLYEKTLPSKEL